MAIRGRNASGLLTQESSTGLNVNTTGTAGPILGACRTSVQIKEAGFTIVQGTAGANNNTLTTATFTIGLFVIPPGTAIGSALEVASIVVPLSQTVGSEFTTRDGTLSFTDNTALTPPGANYKNASERVFPKGTQIYAIPTVAGTNTDTVVAYIQVEEFGAPPA